MMTGNPTSHITVIHKIGEVESTRIYAVSEETLREAQILPQKATGHAVKAFLEKKGCRLDSDSGPAYIERRADGSTSRNTTGTGNTTARTVQLASNARPTDQRTRRITGMASS
jgi:hypothetical protein